MNFSYGAVVNLLNEMHGSEGKKEVERRRNGSREEEEVRDIFQEYQIEEARINELLDPDEPFHIFVEDEFGYVPAWEDFFHKENGIPIYPTCIAKKAMKEMAEDELVGMLLSEHMKEVIRLNCDEQVNLVEHRNCHPLQNTKEHLRFFYPVLNAILNGKKIKYTSQARGMLFEDKIATPYRFLFSNRNNQLQLIIVPEEDERLVLLNFSALRKVEIVEKSSAFQGAAKLLENRRTFFTMEIEDEKNVVERAFTLFSHLNREAYFDKKRNLHVMKVWYYDFDQMDIVRDILSLGPAVQVTEPEELRWRIRDEILGYLKSESR